MFVKFSCGCVGIPSTATAEVRILIPCDGDRGDEELSWATRTMDFSKETAEPLSNDDTAALHRLIAERLHKATLYDDMRRALGLPC